jgi:predicted dehydrogenase
MLTGGTHTVDAVRFLAGDARAEWVIGQIDVRDPNFTNGPIGLQQWEETGLRYGHHVETGAFGLIHFASGVRGTVENGIIGRRGGWPAIVYGTEGMIEIGTDHPEPGEPLLRARLKNRSDWYVPDLVANDPFQVEIEEMIRVLEEGGTHPLGAEAAREVHLIVMAIYESSRRRARIDLPFEVSESPLEAMLRSGEFDPTRSAPVGA